MGIVSTLFALTAALVLGVQSFFPLFGITDRKRVGIHPTFSNDTIAGKCAGVDGSALIHKAFSRLDLRSLRELSSALHTKSGALPTSLHDVLYDVFADHVERLHKELLVGSVTFIFDGKPVPGKKQEKARRAAERRAAFEVAFEAKDETAHKKLLVESLFISWEIYQLGISVCNALKCKTFVAISEADSQLAYMCRIGEVDFVVAEDADFVIHGAPYMVLGWLTPIAKRGGEKNRLLASGCWFDLSIDLKRLTVSQTVEGKRTSAVHDTSDWNSDEFLLLGICLGCDYGTVKGVGPVNAVSEVQKLRE